MATNTAASFTNHTAPGSGDTDGPYSISFNYLDEAEVDVTVGGVLKTKGTHYTFPSATTIQFTSGNHPANGAAIKFQRDTDISAKKVDFQDGSVLTESDLDTNADQVIFGLQEFVDVLNNDVVKRDGSQTVTGNLVFEGSTDNAYETTLAVTDPTADRTITLPNAGGTVLTTESTIVVNSAMIIDGSIVNDDINASAAIAGSKIAAASGSAAGSMSSAHFTKLEGIEANATADQTNAEIRAAVEAATDSNVFTDADHTKLNAIEASATADQTGAEIKSAYEAEANTNAYTDAEKTKLGTVASNADVTSTKNLADLANVHDATPTDGQVLKWVNSNSRWEPGTDATGGGGGVSDGDKGDITVSSSGATWTVDAAAITLGKIADEAVDESRLKVSNTPTDGQYLKYLNSSSQLTWADGTGSSPTTTQGDIIYHNGTNDVRLAKGTAGKVLKMNSGATAPEWGDAAAAFTTISEDGSTGDITFDSTKVGGTGDNIVWDKSEGTLTGGADVTLNIGSARIYEVDDTGETWDGTAVFGNFTAGKDAYINSYNAVKIGSGPNNTNDHVAYFQSPIGGTSTDGLVKLYYTPHAGSPSDRIETTAAGSEFHYDVKFNNTESGDAAKYAYWDTATATWFFMDTVKGAWGDNFDFTIEHDATDTYLDNDTGNLYIRNNVASDVGGDIYIRPHDDEEGIKIIHDGGVEIYHNNVKKLETTATGATVTGNLSVTGTIPSSQLTGALPSIDGSNLTGIASTSLDGCGYQNDQTISAGTYSIAAGKGMHSVGPITNNGTVTVSGNWVIS